MTSPMRKRTNLDGEGAAWAVGAFVASLLIGLLIEPFRGTIGLENVVILYLLVVVAAAAIGGRAAGVVAALSAALAYDYFLTTPYHTLVIDSLPQVITVALLVVTGIVVSIGGRVRRRSAAAAEAHADAIRILHRVTETAAAGGAVDRVAAEGLPQLLGARRVSVLRRSPAGFAVTVDVGDTRPPFDLEALTHLDREGRIPLGHQRVLDGTMVLPLEGVALDLVARQHPIGYLVVIPGRDVPADRTIRLAVAAMANELAIAATEQSQGGWRVSPPRPSGRRAARAGGSCARCCGRPGKQGRHDERTLAHVVGDLELEVDKADILGCEHVGAVVAVAPDAALHAGAPAGGRLGGEAPLGRVLGDELLGGVGVETGRRRLHHQPVGIAGGCRAQHHRLRRPGAVDAPAWQQHPEVERPAVGVHPDPAVGVCIEAGRLAGGRARQIDRPILGQGRQQWLPGWDRGLVSHGSSGADDHTPPYEGHGDEAAGARA